MTIWILAATGPALIGCGGPDTPPLQATATRTLTAPPTLTCPIPIATPGDEEAFGAELPSAELFAQSAKCVPPGALATRTAASPTPPPQATIPPTLLPPVQAQGTTEMRGSPGSCEVWSAGYAMGSFTANMTNHRSLANLANTVSAGFLYPWVLNAEGKTCGMSTIAGDTLNYLVLNSAPSLAAVPYSPNCACLDMVDIDQSFATDLRIGSWCYFSEPSVDDALMAIKSYIAQGHVVQASIIVPWEFGDYTGGVFEVPTTCPTPASTPSTPVCAQHGALACVGSMTTPSGCAQHGIALIGYDDDLAAPNGGRGALRIMNSFGPDWGEAGFMWMTYDGFAAIYLGGTLAFPPHSSAAAAPAVLDAYQWVEQRPAEGVRTHLILDVALDHPVPDAEIRITAPHDRTAHHLYAQALSRGFLYVTRHDDRQFEPGTYRIDIRSSDGTAVTADVTIDLDPASALPSAALPDDLTGSNHQPVTFEP